MTLNLKSLSGIRPNMSRTELDILVVDGNAAEEKYDGRLIKWIDKAWARFNEENAIECVAFTTNYPPEIEIEGVHIGMPLKRVLERYPNMKLVERRRGSKGQVFELHQTSISHDEQFLWVRSDGKSVRSFSLCSKEFVSNEDEKRREQKRRQQERRRRARKFRTSFEMDDPDQMLESWIKYHPGDLDIVYQKRFRALAAWLRQANPDDWHQMAESWNWDYGFGPLLWIVRQPECDLATAAMIYYLADPSHYEGPDNDLDPSSEYYWAGCGLVREIEWRYADEFYSRQMIAIKTGCNPPLERPTLPTKLDGKQLPSGYFNEGIPDEVLEELENITIPRQ